jgi:hypothetical protein
MFSNVALPAGTITVDPRLGPLQDNGGFAPTHALLNDNPAIDTGNNPLALEWDQRLKQRASATSTDIGAFELDRIFSDRFE